mmetsp:Transcript_39710/g.131416  ORF Transcript_39710/g.131416 Transcript_39710/m.131416 type:complete len:201 (+) Transcript_39710:522-1124(+)
MSERCALIGMSERWALLDMSERGARHRHVREGCTPRVHSDHSTPAAPLGVSANLGRISANLGCPSDHTTPPAGLLVKHWSHSPFSSAELAARGVGLRASSSASTSRNSSRSAAVAAAPPAVRAASRNSRALTGPTGSSERSDGAVGAAAEGGEASPKRRRTKPERAAARSAGLSHTSTFQPGKRHVSSAPAATAAGIAAW